MWSTAKIVGLFIILGLSFISALLPCITVRCLVKKFGVSLRFKRAISLLNCLAGGIFFATSVLDLLPEARESMEEVFTERGIDIHFPVTECIMGVGFLFVLFLEHFAHRFCTRVRTLNSATGSQRAKRRKQHPESNVVEGCCGKAAYSLPENSASDDVIIVGDLDDTNEQEAVPCLTYGTITEEAMNGIHKPPNVKIEFDRKLKPNKTHIDHNNPRSESPMEETKILTPRQDLVETVDALQYAELKSKEPKQIKSMRSITLLAALSLHMVFEGLALGLLEKQSDIWQLTLALSIHKALVFFTIGLQLMELLKSVRMTIVVALIFSSLTPLGILIGELITTSGNSDVTRNAVSAVLQAFATGTFVFVTFFEILQGELNAGDYDLLKVFSTVVGFALMGVVRLLVHEH